MFSNPDLNGTVPLRVQPEVGEWGPLEVTTARTKVRQRVVAPLAFLTMLLALVALGTYLFHVLQTGEMGPEAKVIVAIGMWALPALFLVSLGVTIIVWIKGRPFSQLD